MMGLLGLSPLPGPLLYVALGLLVVWRLPSFGRKVLAFMRDLDDYRETRPKRD